MKKIILGILIFGIGSGQLYAQNIFQRKGLLTDTTEYQFAKLEIAGVAGQGGDIGGSLGLKLGSYPFSKIPLGVFFSTALVSTTVSVDDKLHYATGVKYKFHYNKYSPSTFNAIITYGLVGRTFIMGSQYAYLNKSFYNFSIGGGIEVYPYKIRNLYPGFMRFLVNERLSYAINLFYPFGISEVRDYQDQLKKQGFYFSKDPLPFAISFGITYKIL